VGDVDENVRLRGGRLAGHCHRLLDRRRQRRFPVVHFPFQLGAALCVAII